MTRRQPHIVIARTDAGWLARVIAANGREVWRTSETYTRERAARRAVELICGPATTSPHADWPEVTLPGCDWPVEVRTVDERGQG